MLAVKEPVNPVNSHLKPNKSAQSFLSPDWRIKNFKIQAVVFEIK